jgi:tetratricopeptide (TPR) repeat protein
VEAILATRTTNFQRLTLLLHLAQSVWVLAVYEDGAIQRLVMEDLCKALAPLPIYQESLLGRTPDPLAVLQSLTPTDPPALVVFSPLGPQLSELCGYLDIQREALARLPFRLLLWANRYEQRFLADHAPNFYSRLSGVFDFPGGAGGGRAAETGAHQPAPASTGLLAARTSSRRLPYVQVKDERDRPARMDYYQRRADQLAQAAQPNHEAIGDAWYDLAGLLETDAPNRWREAEAAYDQAARAYAQGGCSLFEAEARYQAGDAAMRAYDQPGALAHLQQALPRSRLLNDSPQTTPQAVVGEANVLQAQGDVLAFLDQRTEALARYEQALGLFRTVGARLGEANVRKAQGDVLAFLDQRAEALGKYEEALGLFRTVGARLGEANVLKAQGDVLAFLAQRAEALGKYEEALGLFRTVGARLGEANVLKAQGNLALTAGNDEDAMAWFRQARQLYALVGDRVGPANIGITLAYHTAQAGDLAAAIAYLQPVAQFCLESGHPLGAQLQTQIEEWQAQLDTT